MARDIPNEAGHSGVVALAGPPWIRTTMGYFFPDSIPRLRDGGKSQPCMLKPSLLHSRSSGLPHVADNPGLLRVSCCHSPIGPAQISGGVSKLVRSAAANLPSFETAKSGKLPNA